MQFWQGIMGPGRTDLQFMSTCLSPEAFSRVDQVDRWIVLSPGPFPSWGPRRHRVGNPTYAHTVRSKPKPCREGWSFSVRVKSVIRAGTAVYGITERTWESACRCISAMWRARPEWKTSMKALEIGAWSPWRFCYGLGRFSNCVWLPI